MPPRRHFLLACLGFLIGGTVFLALLLVGSAFVFPPTGKNLSAGDGAVGLLGQLQRALKNQPKRQRFVTSKQAGRLLGVGGSGRRARPTVTSAEHLAYRETLVAQSIARSVFARGGDDCWQQAQTVPGRGPWRGYELDRLRTRLLGERFDTEKDPALLGDYRQAALRALNSPYVNFEDYFWAGHANLYAGDAVAAARCFQQAQDAWPAHDSFYGYIYFFLMCTDATAGPGDRLLAQFADFPQVFPDWLYIEIYVSEVTELQKVYPRAGLLWVLEGEIFSLVRNDARALNAYRRALEVGGFDGVTAGQVRRKIRAIEENL